jgi:hypothetical protein
MPVVAVITGLALTVHPVAGEAAAQAFREWSVVAPGERAADPY